MQRVISNIEKHAPNLGFHLRRSIQTGRYCSYEPIDAVDWEL